MIANAGTVTTSSEAQMGTDKKLSGICISTLLR
jgi:hypothetical protein